MIIEIIIGLIILGVLIQIAKSLFSRILPIIVICAVIFVMVQYSEEIITSFSKTIDIMKQNSETIIVFLGILFSAFLVYLWGIRNDILKAQSALTSGIAKGIEKSIENKENIIAALTEGLSKSLIDQTLIKLATTIVESPFNHSEAKDLFLIYEDLDKYFWKKLNEKAELLRHVIGKESIDIAHITKEVFSKDITQYVQNKYGINLENKLNEMDEIFELQKELQKGLVNHVEHRR